MLYWMLKQRNKREEYIEVKMDEKDNVTEQLKELIFVYGFNKNTLSRYLELPVDRVENLAQGISIFCQMNRHIVFRYSIKSCFSMQVQQRIKI